METKYMVGTLVMVTVVVILAASLLVPVINDVTTTERSYSNEGFYLSDDDSSSHAFVWDGTDLTIDGTEIELPDEGQTPIIVVEGINTFYKNNANMVCTIGGTYTVTAASLTADNGTLSGSVTTSGTTSSVSLSYTDIQFITPSETDVVLAEAPIYVKKDGTVSASGTLTFTDSASNSHLFFWSFDGTLGGSCTASTKSDVASQYAITDAAITYSAVTGYVELYTVDSITFEVAYTNPDDSSVTAEFTVTGELLAGPESVTAELSNHMTAGEIALMSAIPAMVIVATLIMAIGLARIKD